MPGMTLVAMSHRFFPRVVIPDGIMKMFESYRSENPKDGMIRVSPRASGAPMTPIHESACINQKIASQILDRSCQSAHLRHHNGVTGKEDNIPRLALSGNKLFIPNWYVRFFKLVIAICLDTHHLKLALLGVFGEASRH